MLSTADSLPPDRIVGQSAAPGSTAAPGAAVDVRVLRAANALLIYDDNDLMVVNLSAAALDLSSAVFAALDGVGAHFGPVTAVRQQLAQQRSTQRAGLCRRRTARHQHLADLMGAPSRWKA